MNEENYVILELMPLTGVSAGCISCSFLLESYDSNI